ncbi:MAG: hypothetical protein ABSE49_31635 [Polyangiaceae bacterium]
MKRGAAHLFPVLVVLGAMAAAEACGQAETPQGAGGTCQLTSDCQEGYVCITQQDGTRQCSNDLSSIQQSEEAGAEAAATPMMDGAAPQGDGAAPASDGGTPPTPDSGSTAPVDSGSAPPPDSSSPPPPKDSGSPPADTGSPSADTGSPPPEAGE